MWLKASSESVKASGGTAERFLKQDRLNKTYGDKKGQGNTESRQIFQTIACNEYFK